MILDGVVTVNGKPTGPVERFCTICGAVVARGLDDVHTAWHRRLTDLPRHSDTNP